MMEAARTSETSVDNYFTRQYIPKDKSELRTRRREDLKSRILMAGYKEEIWKKAAQDRKRWRTLLAEAKTRQGVVA
jgi:hypothetical protein